MPRCPQSGKQCHDSFYVAARAMKRLAQRNREDVGDINIYRCGHCKKYHIGHRTKPKETHGEH